MELSEAELNFSRRLGSPDVNTRNSALRELKQILASMTVMTDLECMRLWKGMFYCFFLADGLDYQTHLADEIASLLFILRTSTDLQWLFISSFFLTMKREWEGIDSHRVDKFYALFRKVLNSIILYYSNNGWNKDAVNKFENMLYTEIFSSQQCGGIGLHLADIYLEELTKTCSDISSQLFFTAISPFSRVLCFTRYKPLLPRLIKNLLTPLFDASRPILSQVDRRLVLAYLHQLAGHTSCLSSNRQSLYKFISEQPNNTDLGSIDLGISALALPSSSSSTSKHDDDDDEPRRYIKSKRDVGAIPGYDYVSGDGYYLNETKMTRLVERKKKKKEEEESKDAGPSAHDDVVFVPSKHWFGCKPGYKFGKGSSGLGYYVDELEMKKLSKVKKAL